MSHVDKTIIRVALFMGTACHRDQNYTCDEIGVPFLLTGDVLRYAPNAALVRRDGRVVGVRGQNDRSRQYELTTDDDVDLTSAGSHEAVAVTYVECASDIKKQGCSDADEAPLVLHSSGGTVTVDATRKDHRASFVFPLDRGPNAGEAQDMTGCWTAPINSGDNEVRAGAADSGTPVGSEQGYSDE
jgi:hypothetical protein